MAECGGVGGSTNSGNNRGSESVGGNNSAGAANSAERGANATGGNTSVGNTDSQNETAQANNVDGANAKNGIDREAQQKADLNSQMDAAQTAQADTPQTEQTDLTEQTQTEQATTEQTTTEQVKAEQVKAEEVETEEVQEQVKADKTLAETVAEKAKEMLAKAAEFAGAVKESFDQALEKAREQIAQQKELETLARDPRVRAMLDTIGFTEGTGLNYGKVVNGTVIGQNRKDMPFDTTLTAGMRNVSTLDMSQHPNVKVQVNNNIVSSAAGRYQFLSRTWNGVSQKLGLTNFHASSQDLAAVQLMKDRRMIEPLQNGDLQTAVTRGAAEWASLPKADGTGVYAGQNARSFEAIERAYNGFLRDAEAMAQAGDFN